MKPFYTYILQCADRSYYTGHTDDLEKRIAQHQTGTIRGYTYERRPVELMWVQEFTTRDEALSAEVRVKNWSRAKKEAYMRGDFELLSALARRPAKAGQSAPASFETPPKKSAPQDEGTGWRVKPQCSLTIAPPQAITNQ